MRTKKIKHKEPLSDKEIEQNPSDSLDSDMDNLAILIINEPRVKEAFNLINKFSKG